jgi:DNA sulfur modification protein DndD
MEELLREKEGLRQRVSEELRDRTADGVTEEVRGLEVARRQFESARGDLRFELGRIESQMQMLDREFNQKSEVLRKSAAQSGTAAREKRRYELASEARVAAEDLLSRFSTDMRERIEAETDRVFKSLVWKARQFKSVRILDDYRLDVIDRFDLSGLRELSAGERQVLSLAFIVAMSKVTGEEAPLVIDTPFGRISETPLHNIAEALPDISGQLVLLVTDRELDESARKSMLPKIGKEYLLSFNDELGSTELIEEIQNAS